MEEHTLRLMGPFSHQDMVILVLVRKLRRTECSRNVWCRRRRKFQEGREGYSPKGCPEIEQDLGLCPGIRLQI